MTRHVDRSEIVDMLHGFADNYGMTLADFYEHGKADTLDRPELRDLWLIWGDVLTEDDLDRLPPDPRVSVLQRGARDLGMECVVSFRKMTDEEKAWYKNP